MSLSIRVPSAVADSVDIADWVELEAIQSGDGASSFEELARHIHMSGTTDAMDEVADEDDEEADEDARLDIGGSQSQLVATRTWSEIERRQRACGGDVGCYPFEVTAGSILLKQNWEDSAYVFQLLLKQFGLNAGPENTFPERLFERLSGHAAWAYLGGEANSAEVFYFGSPRAEGTGFVSALVQLCRKIGAGQVRTDAPSIQDQKDSHLDVVAWRPFVDGQTSQLILFGQCAVGSDWDKIKLTKLIELQPRNFREKWLTDGFDPDPVRAFFVPRCIEEDAWRNTAIDGGILFDRCRITELVGKMTDPELVARREWTLHVASRLQEVA